MKKINPEISQNFLDEIKNQKIEVVDVDGVKIKTCKNVFPPRSNFSRTSEKLHTIFGDLNGKVVLDVGTGTGIQAIQAIKNGAKNSIGVDINPESVQCAKENVILNGVEDKVQIILSDLFENLQKDQKFNVIIANLPITNFPIEGIVESALYDKDYLIHKRFWSKVGGYLVENGVVIMTHINFNGVGDFEEFENMATENGYAVDTYIEIEDIGYLWRMYRFIRSSWLDVVL